MQIHLHKLKLALRRCCQHQAGQAMTWLPPSTEGTPFVCGRQPERPLCPPANLATRHLQPAQQPCSQHQPQPHRLLEQPALSILQAQAGRHPFSKREHLAALHLAVGHGQVRAE